jgi:hypothetical protein
MKGKLLLLAITSVLILLSFGLCTNAQVKYLGADTKTQGDWIGVYGESGAIIFCNKENHNADLPDPYKPDEGQKLFKKGSIKEIKLSSTGGAKAYGWIFNANPGENKKAPWLTDKSARYAACVSGRSADMAMTLTVDSTHYKVSVYALDFDTTARNFQAFGWQGKDKPDDPDDEIAKYTDGVYVTWEVTGKDPFQFYQKNGAGSVNCVISGVFVDDANVSVEPNGKPSTLWGSIKSIP